MPPRSAQIEWTESFLVAQKSNEVTKANILLPANLGGGASGTYPGLLILLPLYRETAQLAGLKRVCGETQGRIV